MPKVRDMEAIQRAAAKIEDIRTEFGRWLSAQPQDVKDELANLYNRRFNCFVKAKYDGSGQAFPDLVLDAFKEKFTDLYASQKDAVMMLKQNGGGVIDHEVGGGKTLTMCIAAYEMKRLGLASRPMIIGLKANVQAIAQTCRSACLKDLGATFLSGTPISNSLTEMYLIFKYLRPKAMAGQNINSFDAWAAVYAKKTADYEFSVTGEIKQKERFRHFIKVPELAAFYSEITDFKTAKDIGIDRPYGQPHWALPRPCFCAASR